MQREEPGSDEFGVPVHIFQRNGREQVRISLNEFRGTEYIDIRVFYLSEGGYRPSRKGITLGKDLYPEFFHGVMLLGEAMGFDAESLAAILDP